jgi:uncharacterized membrane protein (DUF4010 family)
MVSKDSDMNRHEQDFRKTLKSTLICLGIWVAIMALGRTLPSSVQISPLVFVLAQALIFGLLVAILVLAIAAGIAYARWKGLLYSSVEIGVASPHAISPPVVKPPAESQEKD